MVHFQKLCVKIISVWFNDFKILPSNISPQSNILVFLNVITAKYYAVGVILPSKTKRNDCHIRLSEFYLVEVSIISSNYSAYFLDLFHRKTFFFHILIRINNTWKVKNILTLLYKLINLQKIIGNFNPLSFFIVKCVNKRK